jgi:ribosome-binding factor A
MNERTSSIKRSQRAALYFKEFSILYQQLVQDHPDLAGLFVNRVELSPDGGLCTVFFYCPEGAEDFKGKLEMLKLYKPSLRKSLSSVIKKRRTPDLTFRFDSKFEKQNHLEQLLDMVSKELESSNE